MPGRGADGDTNGRGGHRAGPSQKGKRQKRKKGQQTSSKRERESDRVTALQEAARKKAEELRLGDRSCGKGQILRRAHYRTPPGRSRPTLVPPSCIPDPLASVRRPGELDRRGRSKGLTGPAGERIVVKVEPGRLEKHGYKSGNAVKQRRAALRKAVEHEGRPAWLSIFRRLILLATWNKRKDPELSARFRDDAQYLRDKYRQSR